MSAQTKQKTEIETVSYSLGVNIGENIKKQFENINLDNFEAGIKDVLEKELETNYLEIHSNYMSVRRI